MLRSLGRICYGLSAASILLSLGTQFRMTEPSAFARLFAKKSPSTARSEHQSIFFGLWAPTFAIAGKILEDMAREMDMRQMQGRQGAISSNNTYDTAQQPLSPISR
jgi:hypothetical protein